RNWIHLSRRPYTDAWAHAGCRGWYNRGCSCSCWRWCGWRPCDGDEAIGLIGRMRLQSVVNEDKIIRVRSPDQWARLPRVVAHPEHPQVEQRPHPVERRNVERKGRDAQGLKGAEIGRAS